MRSKITFILLLISLLGTVWPITAMAVEKVRVVALFKNKAMVEIDGKRRFLKAGDTSPEEVRLISANTDEAVIEVNGRQDPYGLGSQYGGSFAKRAAAEVKIWRDTNGAFNTIGSINGRMTDMMVDTGATIIAISEVEAKRLGIQYRLKGKKSGVNTASGFAEAYSLMLDKVKVGDIALQNVQAVVIKGSSPRRVLLGMSFLKRVEMSNQGDMLLLRSKF